MLVTALDVHDEERYAAWYAALHSGAAAGRHAPVVVPSETLRQQLGDQSSRVVRLPFGVFEDGTGTCLGTAVLERDTGHNVHLGEVDVNVPEPYRRRGIGTLLLDRLLAEGAASGLTTLVAEVHAVAPDAAGLAFAARAGFSTVHTEHRLVLDLPLTQDRLAELGGTDSRAGYTLTSWSGATPPQHLETMARLRTLMNAEVPTGDRDADPEVVTAASLAAADRRLLARGYLAYVSLAAAADGSPAGYSLLFASQGDLANAIQDDTYVLTAHRGRRIAGWLKVANLRALQSHLPEVRHLHTWTDELNSPMQTVNAAFGFRPVEVMHEVQHGGRPAPSPLS